MKCSKRPRKKLPYVESFRRALKALKMNVQVDAISSDGVLYVSIGDLPKSGPKASANARVSRFETVVAIAAWFNVTIDVQFVRRPFRVSRKRPPEPPPGAERRTYTQPTTKESFLRALGLLRMPTSKQELAEAWRTAAKRYHPDAPNGDEAAFIAAKRAYDALGAML